MSVLIINSHPRKDSFSDAITHAYRAGTAEAGIETHIIWLRNLSFNLNVIHHSPRQQVLEPDLVIAREMITAANHIVFVYPTWWGTMPALLKGFIDRIWTEGFAFDEIEGGTGYAPLLRGKTAQLITTMDTPWLVYQLIYRGPGHNAMRRAILEFSGFELAPTISFSPVKQSTQTQREKWLEKIKIRGSTLRKGALTTTKKTNIKLIAWLKAIRLQFYPMTAVAYAAGCWSAAYFGYTYRTDIFWTGYGWLFFLEMATVLINEKADYKSDLHNKYFGPFTGGSRVIVDRLLTAGAVRTGIAVTLLASGLFLLAVLSLAGQNRLQVVLACGVLTVLALGYTSRPLKLSYRTFGEIDVGITHSFAVILCGYLFMGGRVSDPHPWILGLPLFISVLPSIILAGIPDEQADRLAGKKTIAVRFGTRNAVRFALIFTCLSVLVLILFTIFELFPVAFKNLLYFVIPHALLLSSYLYHFLKKPELPRRIDSLMIAALTYLVWYALVPLINLT